MINKKEQILELSNMIKEAKKVLVFTGAGISTESGISDYRSKGGLWKRFQPVTIQEFRSSHQKRVEYWISKKELLDSLKDADVNEGHKAIVDLERMDKLLGLITQNIDGLHSRAGTSPQKMVELHGTNLETVCLSCGDITPWQEVYEELNKGIDVPLCKICEGFLKPNTISFGQSLRSEDLNQSYYWAERADLVLAIGSTLVVEPAASIPRIACQHGAGLAIITRSETPLDQLAQLKITESAGETMCAALKYLYDD